MTGKVTIVVIAYNDKKHIGRALDSVVNQTLQEITLICVDDGSTDGTLTVMRSYESKDKRVRVIALEENRGAFYARYAGAMAAESKYIMFLDSDDTFAPEACETLYEEMERRNCDVLQFEATPIPEEGTMPDQTKMEALSRYFVNREPVPRNVSKAELLRICFKEKKLNWTVWNKIYKTELVKKILRHYKGEKLGTGQDVLFSALIYIFCEKAEKYAQKLCDYRVGAGVTTGGAMQTIRNASDMEIRARQALMYPLLMDWLKEENYPIETIQKELELIKEEMISAPLCCLMHRCIQKKRQECLSCITKYWSKEDFIFEFIGYVFDKHRTSGIEAVSTLAGSEYMRITRKEIKTVGMLYFWLSNGGVQRVMALLAPIWERAGYRVVVITEKEEDSCDYNLPQNTKRVILGEEFASNQERAKRLQQVIRENQIDAMVYHAWVSPHFLQDSIVIKGEGIPLIVHTHGASNEPYRWEGAFYIRQHKAYALADVIVALSEVDCAWWKALGYRTVKVANPATFDLEKIVPTALDSKNILYLSRLSPEKQYEDAFSIARLVHQKVPEAKMLVVGKSLTREKDAEIQKKLQHEGMADYVSMEGFRLDVENYYAKAAVFLSTSRTEGFPMTFVESKAFGIPAVAYHLTNLDMMRPPKGMITVPQRDIYGAAQAIIKVLQDDELRLEMGRQARQSVEEIYREDLAITWKNIFDLSLMPIEEEDKSPLETAIYRTMDTVAQKLTSTGNGNPKANQRIYEVEHSTAYRVGRLITYVPRQVKDFVIICKGRGFSAGIAFIKEKLRMLPQVIKRF